MKKLEQFLNESNDRRKKVNLNLTEYQALMLRDFLRDADFSNFGTKEDREDLQKVVDKLEAMSL